MSRLEPENHALEVREAFEQVATPMKLALIGDAPYAQEYIARVRDTRDPRIVMPGAIYGAGYRELGSHCFAYIHATEVGGTHPALIEAMGRGALVLYRNTPENAEVAGDAGIPFESGETAPRAIRARARRCPRRSASAIVRAARSSARVTGSLFLGQRRRRDAVRELLVKECCQTLTRVRFPLIVTFSSVRPSTFSATGGFAAFSNVQFLSRMSLIGAFLKPRSDHAHWHFFTSRFTTSTSRTTGVNGPFAFLVIEVDVDGGVAPPARTSRCACRRARSRRRGSRCS